MDLSKAFDCLTHDILLSKLAAYGLSSQSVKLLENYLTGRKQQIKLQGVISGWQILQKGVPQGSIMGPLLFNIFINDIFYFIEHGTLYNYADDNTLSYAVIVYINTQ
jgi:retron-type reverse transcriptase